MRMGEQHPGGGAVASRYGKTLCQACLFLFRKEQYKASLPGACKCLQRFAAVGLPLRVEVAICGFGLYPSLSVQNGRIFIHYGNFVVDCFGSRWVHGESQEAF
jgi:Zn-finger protein